MRKSQAYQTWVDDQLQSEGFNLGTWSSFAIPQLFLVFGKTKQPGEQQ